MSRCHGASFFLFDVMAVVDYRRNAIYEYVKDRTIAFLLVSFIRVEMISGFLLPVCVVWCWDVIEVL